MYQCLVCGRLFENVASDDDATSASSLLVLLDRGPFDDPAHDLSLTHDRVPSKKCSASKKKQKGKNGKKEECVMSELLCSICLSLLEDAQGFEARLKDTLLTLRERVWDPDEEKRDHVDEDVANAPHDWLGFLKDEDEVLVADDSADDSESESDDALRRVESAEGVLPNSEPRVSQIPDEVAQLTRPSQAGQSEDNVVFDEPGTALQKAVPPRRYTAKALRSVAIQSSEDEALTRVEEEESWSCSMCFASFVRARNMVKHLALHNGTVLRCPKCDNAFLSEDSYHIHILECAFNLRASGNDEEQDGGVACTYCGKTLASLRLYKAHLLRSHLGRMYACGICFKNFARRNELGRHISAAHGGGKFSCSDCRREFAYRSDRDRHQREVHAAAKCSFRCNCGKGFTSQRRLSEHTNKYHTKSHLWRICEECGERSYFGPGRDNHYKKCAVANAGSSSKCPICAKTFETPAKLKSHEAVCKTPRRFNCEVCGKSFKFKCRLVAHSALHTGEKTVPTSKAQVSTQPAAVSAETHQTQILSSISVLGLETGQMNVSGDKGQEGRSVVQRLEEQEQLHLFSSLNLPHVGALGASPMDLFDL